MTTTIAMTPIGRVMSARDEAIDDAWDSVATTIVLDPGQLKPDAAAGLEAFSHIVVTYVFDRVGDGGSSAAPATLAAEPTGRRSASWPSAPRTGRTGSASPPVGSWP
jgi:tRNA (Thr-GGU) A37 N-methylase